MNDGWGYDGINRYCELMDMITKFQNSENFKSFATNIVNCLLTPSLDRLNKKRKREANAKEEMDNAKKLQLLFQSANMMVMTFDHSNLRQF